MLDVLLPILKTSIPCITVLGILTLIYRFKFPFNILFVGLGIISWLLFTSFTWKLIHPIFTFEQFTLKNYNLIQSIMGLGASSIMVPFVLCAVQWIFLWDTWFTQRSQHSLPNIIQNAFVRWFFGYEAWAFIFFQLFRMTSDEDLDAGRMIPYKWSLCNASFLLDTSHLVLLLSIPVSLILLYLVHNHYMAKNSTE